MNIDNSYFAYVHLYWLRKRLPYKLQTLYETGDLVAYLNNTTRRAERRAQELVMQQGKTFKEVREQIRNEILCLEKEFLSPEDLANYVELDLLQLTAEERIVHGTVYKKIERWYRIFSRNIPSHYYFYYRVSAFREAIRLQPRKKRFWKKASSINPQIIGVKAYDMQLNQVHNHTKILCTFNQLIEETTPATFFLIDGAEVKPIDFADFRVTFEYAKSFCICVKDTLYQFHEGDNFEVNRNRLYVL